MNALTTKIEAYSTETLKSLAVDLMNDTREGTDLVFNSIISILCERMPEDKFIVFTETL